MLVGQKSAYPLRLFFERRQHKKLNKDNTQWNQSRRTETFHNAKKILFFPFEPREYVAKSCLNTKNVSFKAKSRENISFHALRTLYSTAIFMIAHFLYHWTNDLKKPKSWKAFFLPVLSNGQSIMWSVGSALPEPYLCLCACLNSLRPIIPFCRSLINQHT